MKKIKVGFYFILLLIFPVINLSSQKWQSDNGDGTYTNPLIYSDFPDPDVILVDSTYYMVSTTMFIFPGVTILKSYDLVNWEYCCNAVERMDFSPCYNLDGCNRYSHGQWATSLKYHNGKFHLLFITLDEGGFHCTADKAEGPWEITHLPRGFYDPGLFFDDDEKIYVAHGYSDIYVTELDTNFAPKGSDVLVFTGDIRPGLEGSHVYKLFGYYYLYCTYGGGDGFQVALRSTNIYGPYEEKIVIRDNGNLGTGIHQGALIETQTGEWWSVIFQDGGAFGRFPTLQPVTWVDDWPMVGVDGKGVVTYQKPNVGKEYPIKILPTSDEFDSTKLGMQWGWNHNPDSTKWSLTENPGYLRLYTAKVVSNLRDALNTLTQRIFAYYSKTIATTATVKTNIDNMQEGDVAGLAVFQDPYAYIGIKKMNGLKYVVMVNNGIPIDSVEINNSIVYLRAIADYGTSKASFAYSLDEQTFTALGNQLSMQFSLTIFTGNKFCLFNYATIATGGFVDFDWFLTDMPTSNSYRSHQSGSWNDVNIWEKFIGPSWEYPAPNVPDFTCGPITIQSGHQVEVTETDSVDQLWVMSEGVLVINSGVSLYIKDGIGTDLLAGGTTSNEGSIIKDTTAMIEYTSGSKYSHRQDGGVVPTAIWRTGSICEITEVVNNAPANLNQDFYNFSWNCAGQNSDASLGWQSGNTINGTLIVTNTNWDHVSRNNPSHRLELFDGLGSCTINNLVVNGYNAALTAQSGDYMDTVEVNGNITLSNGGMLSLSNSSGGVTAWYVDGDFAVSDSAYIGKSSSENVSRIIFRKAGVQNFTLPSSGVTFFGAPNIVVDSGTTLNIGTSVFGGEGSFQLQRGATLQTGHPNGIDSSITCSGANGGGNYFSKAGGYTFNGSVAQQTGNLLPDTVSNLTIDNSSGVTLQGSVIVNNTMEMKSGALLLGGNVLSYGVNGTLKYSLSSTQPTADAEFPLTGGPVHLAIANAGGAAAILHSNRSIPGNLDLTGGKLETGANTLTAGSATTASVTTMFVNTDGGGKLRLPVGNSTEVLYPIGASGGGAVSYCPLWITNNEDSDTITLGAVMDTTSQSTKPRVKLKWEILESGVDGGDYELKFGWNPSSTHENTLFRASRVDNARIFLVDSDTIEAGSGDYEFNFATKPYTVKRGGISELGMFVVGRFKDSVWEGVAEKPRSYRLMQNYPNPFNRLTFIEYELPKDEEVKLIIYNLIGQEIAVLERGKKEAGYHKVEWKASNLPTSIYFYRLTAGSFTGTKKLLLIK